MTMKRKMLTVLICLLVTAANAQTGKIEQLPADIYNAIKSEPDPFRMEQLMRLWEQESSEKDNTASMDYCRQLVATAFAEHRNLERSMFWYNRIQDLKAKDKAAYSLVVRLIEVDELAAAESVLIPVWERLKREGGKPSETASGLIGLPGYTPSQYACQYGMILYKKGEYKKALPHLAPDSSSRQRPKGVDEAYALVLAKLGETDRAVSQIRSLILKQPHREEALSRAFKNVFEKKYGGNKEYEALMDSARANEDARLQQKISKMRTMQPSPDFELTGLNGDKISLQSLRGKTVILDFWATWCQPCVASFPGMQQAVDHYKNDTSVVFLFIHTLERNNDPVGDVKQFMNYKKYRFNVYMDFKDKKTGICPVQTAFNIRAIPTKFIIDKNGMIRYRNTGFVSEEEGLAEIRMMLESL